MWGAKTEPTRGPSSYQAPKTAAGEEENTKTPRRTAGDDLRRLIELQDGIRESYREIGEIKKRNRVKSEATAQERNF